MVCAGVYIITTNRISFIGCLSCNFFTASRVFHVPFVNILLIPAQTIYHVIEYM